MIKILTEDQLNKVRIEKDMLTGNINRMCVTDDIFEFVKMYYFAKRRIDLIFDLNFKRFKNEEDN